MSCCILHIKFNFVGDILIAMASLLKTLTNSKLGRQKYLKKQKMLNFEMVASWFNQAGNHKVYIK